MAHHKRKKPKNARSGCLMCKPHKVNGGSEKCLCDTSNGRQEFIAREILKRYERGEEE
jgi:hypothetical protein